MLSSRVLLIDPDFQLHRLHTNSNDPSLSHAGLLRDRKRRDALRVPHTPVYSHVCDDDYSLCIYACSSFLIIMDEGFQIGD